MVGGRTCQSCQQKSVWCERQRWSSSALVRGFLADSTCRICSESLVREIALIGRSCRWTSSQKQTQKQRGKAPWACHCSFHGYTHLAQLLLIFLFCLFTNVICNSVSDILSVQRSCISESGLKMLLNHNNSLYICGEGFVLMQVQHMWECWWPDVVLVVWIAPLFGPTMGDKMRQSDWSLLQLRLCCQFGVQEP